MAEAFTRVVSANPGLKKISLGAIGLSTADATKFLNNTTPPPCLAFLDISGAMINNDEALSALAAFIKKTPNLEKLYVSGSQTKIRADEGMKALAEAIGSHPSLSFLRLAFANDYFEYICTNA